MNYKIINIVVLLVAIIMVFAFRREKHLYYDEPFQVMCSNGITNINIEKLSGKPVISSKEISAENTLSNVFYGGGDSFHYVLLHYFTKLFGNTVDTYVSFAVMWSILTLIAFYFLSTTVFGNTLFVSLAILLLFGDMVFFGQLFSIRHYMMSLFFTILSGIFFFRYMLKESSARNFALLCLFSALSILAHYFTFYVVAMYGVILFFDKRKELFSKTNLSILVVTGITLGLYMFFHANAASIYSFDHVYNHFNTNAKKYEKLYTVGTLLSIFLKSIAINFKLYYTLFNDAFIIRLISVGLVAFIYVYGVRKIDSEKERKLYTYLLILSLFGNVFIAAFAYVSKANKLFNFRYLLFTIPFCTIFLTMCIKTLFTNRSVNVLIRYGLPLLIFFPVIFEFSVNAFKNVVKLPCNHTVVADRIRANKVDSLEVPEIVDAVFINCLLPDNYQINYILNPNSNIATLHSKNGTEQIPLFKNDLIVLY
jgi:uncharacterized membrane protein